MGVPSFAAFLLGLSFRGALRRRDHRLVARPFVSEQQGQGPWGDGEQWEYVEDPGDQVVSSEGQKPTQAKGATKSEDEAKKKSKELSQKRSKEIKQSMPKNGKGWSDYPQHHRRQQGSKASGGGSSQRRPS